MSVEGASCSVRFVRRPNCIGTMIANSDDGVRAADAVRKFGDTAC